MSNVSESGPSEEFVRARAYALWESEGRPDGRDAEHWLRSVEEAQRLREASEKPVKKAAKKAPAKSRARKSA